MPKAARGPIGERNVGPMAANSRMSDSPKSDQTNSIYYPLVPSMTKPLEV